MGGGGWAPSYAQAPMQRRESFEHTERGGEFKHGLPRTQHAFVTAYICWSDEYLYNHVCLCLNGSHTSDPCQLWSSTVEGGANTGAA